MRKYVTIALMCLFSFTLISQSKEIVIIHTNDTHSQIESFTDKEMGIAGGILKRDAVISQSRNNTSNSILVDAGDFVQGTPYFNFYKGEVEILMMNKLGYDVATLGNHEFDNGPKMLADMLRKANFKIVCSNYDFTGTDLDKLVEKTIIIDKAGLKIGFIGIGVNPKGLIDSKNFEGIKYLDPVETMNKYSSELKSQGCDYIVVLSHMGIFEDDDKGDILLAKESKDVDLIIGGHTHTFMNGCKEIKNKSDKPVTVTQSGSKGAKIGKITVEFDNK